jgi:hypothetical protein
VRTQVFRTVGLVAIAIALVVIQFAGQHWYQSCAEFGDFFQHADGTWDVACNRWEWWRGR